MESALTVVAAKWKFGPLWYCVVTILLREPCRESSQATQESPLRGPKTTSRSLPQGGRTANQYELPLGWNGLLPLVADLCQKANDL